MTNPSPDTSAAEVVAKPFTRGPLRYACTVCGRVTIGRCRTKDGGEKVFPLRHLSTDGGSCPGQNDLAEIVHLESPEFRRNMIAFIESSSIPEPNTGCWIWLGQSYRAGYGYFNFEGRRLSAHRASYESMHGRVLDNRLILHSCDNPICVNPDHLRLGTPADNMLDRTKRNRTKPGGGPIKLDYAKAAAIRARCIRGDFVHGVLALSREYGVNSATIRAVLDGRTWVEKSNVGA